jgi:glutamate transport system permease protein
MSTVLYDALGPHAKRRVSYATAVIGAIATAVAALIIWQLARQGQFSADLWGPIINPANDDFALLWTFLLGGLAANLLAAAVAIVLSLGLGTLLAVSRVSATQTYRWAIVGFIELFRGVPVVLSIFFAARALPELGVSLPVFWYIIIGLTLYNSVVIAEVLRTGINALPKGQSEAAVALGLSRAKTLQKVILPQAFRLMLPVLIGQLVVIVKDTSLCFIISFEELLRRSQIAIQSLHNPLQMYFVVAVIFIVLNTLISILATRVEKRLSRSKTAPPTEQKRTQVLEEVREAQQAWE